jgi:hypothetical protein
MCWAKLSLGSAIGSASAIAAAALKIFKLVIFGSISGVVGQPIEAADVPETLHHLCVIARLSVGNCMGDERIALILRHFAHFAG